MPVKRPCKVNWELDDICNSVLSIKIVLDSFYLLILYSEKFSTWIWRLPFTVNVSLNLSNIIRHYRPFSEYVLFVFLRAVPRKYQLDVEIVKKWPGLKLSQNMGPTYKIIGLSTI